jgi:guanylate kinase
MKRLSYENHTYFNLSKRPLLIVVSGPSGAGKDTVLTRMKESGIPLEYVVTATTRPQRDNEKNNIHYHFISTERFQEMIERKEFLEWANVYGNWYGVPKKPIKRALDKGQDTIVKVDIQGATTIKKILPQGVYIFLVPPSIEELASRLKLRRTESSFDLDVRIKTAKQEIKQLSLFDYVVVNKQDKVDQAVSVIKAIISAEKHRVTLREVII